MEPETKPALSPRAIFVSAAALGVAWQVVVIVHAFRYAPALQSLLRDLGAEAPPLTRSFLASYQWWILAPLLAAVLAADVARRARPPLLYGGIVLLVSLAPGLVLQTWMTEAWFRPILTIMTNVR
jgi:hypothetical protein